MLSRLAVVTVGALVSGVVCCGCVASADAPSPTDPNGLTTGPSRALDTIIALEEGLGGFRGCLADNGISIPEIRLDGLGRPRMAVALADLDLSERSVLDALSRCAPLLSTGALDLRADPELEEIVRSSLRALARCVRLGGVTGFPDPVPGFDGVGPAFPADRVPWADPLLAGAMAACASPMTGGDR